MPICYSPLALPLGELSPQVTERALQPFLFTLSVLAALGHLSQGRGKGRSLFLFALYFAGKPGFMRKVYVPSAQVVPSPSVTQARMTVMLRPMRMDWAWE